jgi:hypothetical protein
MNFTGEAIMKKLLVIAFAALIACAVMTPRAQAQIRFSVDFGFGYGHGYGYGYGHGYPYPHAYFYGSWPCAYPRATTCYGSPFVTYGYIPPPRIHAGPLFRSYTLYGPRTRMVTVPYRAYRGPDRVYGGYVPRVYRRAR